MKFEGVRTVLLSFSSISRSRESSVNYWPFHDPKNWNFLNYFSPLFNLLAIVKRNLSVNLASSLPITISYLNLNLSRNFYLHFLLLIFFVLYKFSELTTNDIERGEDDKNKEKGNRRERKRIKECLSANDDNKKKKQKS